MSGAAGVALLMLGAAAAPVADGGAEAPRAGAPAESGDAAPAPTPGPPGRPRRERSVDNELPLAPGTRGPDAGEPPRPAQLSPRSVAVAAALGGVVGFGSGLHYAGEPVGGTAFGVIDGVLLFGLTAFEVVLNRDALQHDYVVGKSLGRGERSMTGHERSLAAGAWVSGGLLLASHVVQALLGARAARSYDAALESISCVPLGGDAAPR